MLIQFQVFRSGHISKSNARRMRNLPPDEAMLAAEANRNNADDEEAPQQKKSSMTAAAAAAATWAAPRAAPGTSRHPARAASSDPHVLSLHDLSGGQKMPRGLSSHRCRRRRRLRTYVLARIRGATWLGGARQDRRPRPRATPALGCTAATANAKGTTAGPACTPKCTKADNPDES